MGSMLVNIPFVPWMVSGMGYKKTLKNRRVPLFAVGRWLLKNQIFKVGDVDPRVWNWIISPSFGVQMTNIWKHHLDSVYLAVFKGPWNLTGLDEQGQGFSMTTSRNMLDLPPQPGCQSQISGLGWGFTKNGFVLVTIASCYWGVVPKY